MPDKNRSRILVVGIATVALVLSACFMLPTATEEPPTIPPPVTPIPTPTEQPTVEPTPAPTSTPDEGQAEEQVTPDDSAQPAGPTRIQFEPGAVSATVQGNLAANGIDEYVLYALEGQTMSVTITSPGNDVYLSITGLTDGIPLVRAASDATGWKGELPATQDYSIKAVSGGPADSYTLEVTILPLEPVADWQPVPIEICQDFQVSVAGTLGVTDVTLDEDAPFEDYINGTTGTGCLITAYGTGADFADIDVYAVLKEMLVTYGWTPDIQYDASGPTGMAGGFRRDYGLLILSASWEPSEDANCPSDQPISACELAPEQQIWTITLSIAMQ
jgi:hypothetical protein